MATTLTILGATSLSASLNIGLAALVRTALLSVATVAGRAILAALLVGGVAGVAVSLS